MKRTKLTALDLKRELQDWQERFPRLKEDELFVAWFLRAFVVDEDVDAVKSLTGGAGDKDADAVFFDERAKIVFIVQGKYRKDIWEKAESRNDVMSFAELAPDLCGDKSFLETRLKATSPKVRDVLQEARKRILDRGYRLQLHYVTIGRVSSSVEDEALTVVRRFADVASLDILDGREVLLMLADYLDGVAPPVPMLDLPMESGEGVACSGPLNRKDDKTGIEAWIFSMTSDAVAAMFDRAGVRLFARNVRGFLGRTEINTSMQETLARQPWNFWYYNNGITIICDNAQIVPIEGRNFFRVKNPQVINGQQTTRMLHAEGKDGRGASVLVRVFRVPRQPGDGSDGFDTLVSNIVKATNWQNAIRPSDLISNDRRQIEIERQFRKYNYLYIRKRQTKGEALRAPAAARYLFAVKKDDLAQAVAACDLDPAVVREGKEKLFEERWYSHVFPHSDPGFYLCRYWLMQDVAYAARGYPERAYAKWLVTNFMWLHLRPLLFARAKQDTFRRENESFTPTFWALVKAIGIAFRAVLGFYRAKRGKGAKAIDVSTFFQRRKLNTEFAKFWHGSSNKHRSAFKRAWRRFEGTFRDAVEA
jgi:hypothetical protein